MTASELNLIGLNELPKLGRWDLERRARALAQSTYLGDGVCLSRVLGRYKLYVDSRDVGFGAHIMLDGSWEPWLTTFMARQVKPGMNVVDMGANHGYYSLLFADLVGASGRVAAIEPNPHLCRLLRKSLTVNGFDTRCEVFQAAATAADNLALELWVPADEPKNGRVLPQEQQPQGGERAPVRGQTATSLLKHWDRVDYVKIDIEGGEEDALAGLWPILERDRPQVVLEYNVGRCRDPNALLERLSALYGGLKTVNFEAATEATPTGDLLDRGRTEDWIIYLSR